MRTTNVALSAATCRETTGYEPLRDNRLRADGYNKLRETTGYEPRTRTGYEKEQVTSRGTRETTGYEPGITRDNRLRAEDHERRVICCHLPRAHVRVGHLWRDKTRDFFFFFFITLKPRVE